ncbi:dTDP-4-dehydrorhamnose 3,5-epimerase family protein [Amantichitinum ursilacus]|uniref:dTDP-4-dehydrorhamnose 3,5-epimerase n=1 Tax=Amantichitinum ursilacus TaxID=857265 RepID=A0A0N0GNN1_9NEIS|nr:dTDP-4-dehydrorhamnose 3,5-epimerase family protein [Amantichitinum ursilacus]KPC52693.1 dTDP-4-dehydrorhamnose 3,5-epimerase [Amantichitinum ursilacus]
MLITPLPIAGAALLTTERRGDTRGSFGRWYGEDELGDWLGGQHIVQINHSFSARQGTVRGLHFQHAPQAELKIVRCLSGQVWDVFLDLRHGSPTFMQWHAEWLDGQHDRALLIPPGCAHGFQTQSDAVQMLYLHTAFYTPELEGAVRYNDPRAAIAWPLPITELSARDQANPLLSPDFDGITL